MSQPFILVTPSTRGLSLALTRYYLRTTNLPVYATHRSGTPHDVKRHILSPLPNVDPARLSLLPLDLTSEGSIKSAADLLSEDVGASGFLHVGFFTGGILHPEKQTADIDFEKLKETFQINTISHLLLIKHFSRFLPTSSTPLGSYPLSKWVHMSARVGSIEDNKTGGWFSYRSSKAALNQIIKTFDNMLQLRKSPTLCVGLHPGTVRTDLSNGYWQSARKAVFDPDEAAEKLGRVIHELREEQRGKLWDYAGKQVPW